MSMGSEAAHSNANQSCLIGEVIHIIIETPLIFGIRQYFTKLPAPSNFSCLEKGASLHSHNPTP